MLGGQSEGDDAVKDYYPPYHKEDGTFVKTINPIHTGIKGDVNGDAKVGIGDIIAVTNFMADSEQSGLTLELVDVNGDGLVGVGDIITITNIMAGN